MHEIQRSYLPDTDQDSVESNLFKRQPRCSHVDKRLKYWGKPMTSFGRDHVSAFENGRQHGSSLAAWAGDCPYDREARPLDHREWFDGFSQGRMNAGLIPISGRYMSTVEPDS